jgi:hypothetical protein
MSDYCEQCGDFIDETQYDGICRFCYLQGHPEEDQHTAEYQALQEIAMRHHYAQVYYGQD